MKTKPHVYVAGPYTNPYPIHNMRNALIAADGLWATGVAHPVVPHLTGFWDFLSPRPYEYWLEYDLESMRSCDCVWRIPGASSGADAECDAAREMGIPVFTDVDDVIAFCKQWANEQQRQRSQSWQVSP